ncbi:hypothetical protein C427_2951 [Paraglaciecola psychrophila 170]|uniref:Uncharacterized protein n=1 Tax=Paraglaciecola psychrophila 170 TaxID=1129794 RepID=M4RN40_9ALTE|nr:hypothetical protein C427_2951 [Paraglaciecola psychrophila 170]
MVNDERSKQLRLIRYSTLGKVLTSNKSKLTNTVIPPLQSIYS